MKIITVLSVVTCHIYNRHEWKDTTDTTVQKVLCVQAVMTSTGTELMSAASTFKSDCVGCCYSSPYLYYHVGLPHVFGKGLRHQCHL